MKAHQAAHSIATLCSMLDVSPSGYYAWRHRGASRRAQEDDELLREVQAIHRQSRGTYGAPRIQAELRARGRRVGRKRVARVLRAGGLQGVSRRKFVRTTVRAAEARTAPDLVQRRFTATQPNQLWVADITYVPTARGFLYLAVVLDAWSRLVVGWAMQTTLTTDLVLTALDMAVRDRQPRDVIHHSDHGCQYTSLAFGRRCRDAGVRPSMGSVGDAYDNAMCESFFATLECELLDRCHVQTPAEARLAIFDFIEGFYNTHRRHSRLGYVSPLAFERAARAVEAAGAVDAENASTSSLENAPSAFPTAPTATTLSLGLARE
jgi:putative transposase